MNKPFSPQSFQEMPVVGILRNFTLQEVSKIVPAVVEGGITTLEVTFNTPGAADQIREIQRRAGDSVNVGAGTVTSLAELNQALEAGASFIVTPVIVADLIRACRERGIPVFPGAFTPTEIFQAWRAGAYMVKLFPANQLGPSYIKDIKAPLPEVRILATGGIRPETIGDYLRAGADGFGVGSPLFSREHIQRGDWDWLRQRAELFCRSYKQAVSECSHAEGQRREPSREENRKG